jgi:hypothetical protein
MEIRSSGEGMHTYRFPVRLNRHGTVSIRSKYLRARVLVALEHGRNGMAKMVRATGAYHCNRRREPTDKLR